MSLDATRWAWSQQGLRPLHKLILLALADRAGADGRAFPSYELLMADTGADRKTIWTGLKVLQEKKLISDSGERKGTTGLVIVWQLHGIEHRHDNGSVFGTVKQFRKRNGSENGTVPKTDSNSSENGTGNSSENGTVNLPVNQPGTDQERDGAVAPPPSNAKPKRTRAAKPDQEPKGRATWEAYSAAYQSAYGTPPIRNSKVNGQIANLVDRLGAELAPEAAAYYLTMPNPFYASRRHPVDLLLKDAETIGAECQRWIVNGKAPTAGKQGLNSLGIPGLC